MSNSALFSLPSPPKGRISSLSFAPRSPSSSSYSTKLLASCWDGYVYLYDADQTLSPDPEDDMNGSGNGEAHGSASNHDEIVTKGRLLARFGHPAPVLAVVFGRDETEAFTAGLDWVVRRIHLPTGTILPISRHSQAVCALAYSHTHNLLITASWDKTIHTHSLAPSSSGGEVGDNKAGIVVSVGSINLPEKPFAITVSPTKIVVAMAHRAVNIYQLSDLQTATRDKAPARRIRSPDSDANDDGLAAVEELPSQLSGIEPWQRRESSLRFMTRAVACMPNDDGYASSSIEGRVAVEWFDDSDESQARKYAFKCHRQTQPLSELEPDRMDESNGPTGGDTAGNDQLVDVVYPVNALAFHPVHGTFASGGGDGSVALWDGVAKRRIRQYHRLENSVMAMQFDGSGRRLAIAVSPGFRDGIEDEEHLEGPDGSSSSGKGGAKVYVRMLDESEAKPKKK